MSNYGLQRSWPNMCMNNPVRKIYEGLKVYKQEYAQKASKNEQFLQRFGYNPNDIPEGTFIFLLNNVHEFVWEHMDILPVYITSTSQDVLSDMHENEIEEQLKTIDKKVQELQRKEVDMQRKLDYKKKIREELENKFSVPQAFIYNARKAAYEKELISKTLSFQGTPDLAQIFIEIKKMNNKLNTLKEDIATAKAKLSKYGQLPPNVHEGTIVMNEAVRRYNNDATKMKNKLIGNPTNYPVS